MERVKEYVNDKNGPKVFVNPASNRKTSLLPISTNPIPDTLTSEKSHIDSSPVSSKASTAPSTASGSSKLSKQSSQSSNGSTAPSTVSAEDAADMAFPEWEYILPCLLHKIANCPVRFHRTDFHNWCSHNLSHLRGHPPPSTFCVFCDAEFGSENALSSWQTRMTHIAGHFHSGLTMDVARPDFRVLRHMLLNGWISEEMYDVYMTYTERPYVEGLRPHDYVPDEIIEQNKSVKRLQNRVPVPVSREEMRNSKLAKALKNRGTANRPS